MLNSVKPEKPLDAMFVPRSVALVGVSDRPNTYGYDMDRMCHGGRYSGRVFRVNPRLVGCQAETFGSLAELPIRPDHVVLGLATCRVERAIDQAIEVGARAITVFAECPDEDLRRRMGDKLVRAGVQLCGPNSMGLHNLTDGLRITPFSVPLDRVPGRIGLIAQSGSVLGALLNNAPQLRFAQAISTGSETVTTAADYLNWMVERPDTNCIGLFLETVRDPQSFLRALQKASETDKPIVILKVGSSAVGARMAVSHTGAIVGDDAVFRAVVKRYGAHLASNLDEMAAMLGVFSQGRRAPSKGLASIHDSGGERELIADLAETAGLEFAKLNESTLDELHNELEVGIKPDNPLDAWATGKNAEQSFAKSTTAIMSDANVGMGLYVLNWRDNYLLHERHERALSAAFRETEKPLIAVANYSLSDHKALAARFADHGIPLIGGLQNALVAAKALFSHKRMAGRVLPDAPHPETPSWKKALERADWFGEAQGYELFSGFDINVPDYGLAKSRDEAVNIAREISGPVILKTAKAGISHKSDVNGVFADLNSPQEVANAYDDIASRLSKEVLVAKMLDRGSEWSLGIVVDPQFGPMIRIAPGGILVELMPEQVLLPSPITESEARDAILSLRASVTLQGYRGQSPKALGAFSKMAAALSRLAYELKDTLLEVEINPVIVTESEAIAADAVIQTQKM